MPGEAEWRRDLATRGDCRGPSGPGGCHAVFATFARRAARGREQGSEGEGACSAARARDGDRERSSGVETCLRVLAGAAASLSFFAAFAHRRDAGACGSRSLVAAWAGCQRSVVGADCSGYQGNFGVTGRGGGQIENPIGRRERQGSAGRPRGRAAVGVHGKGAASEAGGTRGPEPQPRREPGAEAGMRRVRVRRGDPITLTLGACAPRPLPRCGRSLRAGYTLKRNSSTSPSFTSYSFPSTRLFRPHREIRNQPEQVVAGTDDAIQAAVVQTQPHSLLC